MLKKLIKYLLIIVAIFYVGFQIYLNVTTEVFISNTDILKGTSFDTVQLSSTRMLKNRVPSNAIGNAYYFVGKVALADINANTIISANRVGLFYQEDVVSEIDLETLEKLALIYVPVTNETIYSSVKANDVVNFMFYINTAETENLGGFIHNAYGIHGVVQNVVKVDTNLLGIDVYVNREYVHELSTLLDLGTVKVVRVFSTSDRLDEITLVTELISNYLLGGE